MRLAVGVMTGHCRTNYYLYTIGKRNDDTCRWCHLEREDIIHVLTECPALARLRSACLGVAWPSQEDISATSLTGLAALADKLGL